MTSPHVAVREAQRARTGQCAPTSSMVSGTTFTREADMIAPILEAASEFTRGLADAAVHAYLEVALAGGVPDVVLVAFNEDAIRRRLAAGLGPVTSLADIRALDALAHGITDLGDVATYTGLSRAHLRRTVVPALVAGGWVDPPESRETRIDVRFVHEPLTQWVVTVEAKRSAWAAAVAQARRHLIAADRAFVALDARRARRAIATAPALARHGVGVATVATASESAGRGSVATAGVVSYPDDRRPGLPANARLPRPADRRLVAERVWELRLRGARSGPTYPVFGRDLSA